MPAIRTHSPEIPNTTPCARRSRRTPLPRPHGSCFNPVVIDRDTNDKHYTTTRVKRRVPERSRAPYQLRSQHLMNPLEAPGPRDCLHTQVTLHPTKTVDPLHLPTIKDLIKIATVACTLCPHYWDITLRTLLDITNEGIDHWNEHPPQSEREMLE